MDYLSLSKSQKILITSAIVALIIGGIVLVWQIAKQNSTGLPFPRPVMPQFGSESEAFLRVLPDFCRAVQILPEDESLQSEFGQVISVVQNQAQAEPLFLYGAMVSEGIFAKALVQRVQYDGRECSDEECSFSLTLQQDASGQPETILPFLLTAVNEAEEAVAITGSSFNPTTSKITLQTASSVQDGTVTFIFPTCSGSYYEAVASDVS